MLMRDILKAAAALPDTDRVVLIEALLESFGPSSSDPEDAAAAWLQVAAERAAELDSGVVNTVPWEEVCHEGERRIHGRSSL